MRHGCVIQCRLHYPTTNPVLQAALEADGEISRAAAYALVSTNLEQLLGVDPGTGVDGGRDLVATKGGDLMSFEGKVVGVISPRRAVVDLF